MKRRPGPRLLARALRRQVEETRETMRAVESAQEMGEGLPRAVRLAGLSLLVAGGVMPAAVLVPLVVEMAREAAARPKPEPEG